MRSIVACPGRLRSYQGAFDDGLVVTSYRLDVGSDGKFVLVRKAYQSPKCPKGLQSKPSLGELRMTGTVNNIAHKNPLVFDPTQSWHWIDGDLPDYSRIGCGFVDIKTHVENQKRFPNVIVRMYARSRCSRGTLARTIDACIGYIARTYNILICKRTLRLAHA
mmetsp:Transcript_24458/g.42802  ORF Transcript_24458/g.42802 Transcript_24458/m.42802 type:complete len:163 (-) Transcript_24458:335-823(-)